MLSPDCVHVLRAQAMDAREAHEMLRVWRQNPGLVAQIVPSPITLPYDSHIQDIIRCAGGAVSTRTPSLPPRYFVRHGSAGPIWLSLSARTRALARKTSPAKMPAGLLSARASLLLLTLQSLFAFHVACARPLRCGALWT